MSSGMVVLRSVQRFARIPSLLASSSTSRQQRCSTRGFASAKLPSSLFGALDTFPERHIGPDDHEAAHMLSTLGYDNMDAFVDAAVPSKVRVSNTAVTDATIPSFSESELYYRAKELGGLNKPFKSYIGLGYHNAVVPPVILRNVSFARFLLISAHCHRIGHGESCLVYSIHSLST